MLQKEQVWENWIIFLQLELLELQKNNKMKLLFNLEEYKLKALKAGYSALREYPRSNHAH